MDRPFIRWFALDYFRSILSFHLPHPRKAFGKSKLLRIHSVERRARAAMTTREPYALHWCLLLFLMLLCNMELTPERYTREANDFLKNFHNEFSHSVERNEFGALVELKFCRQRRADRDENLIKNSHAADRPVAVDEAVF